MSKVNGQIHILVTGLEHVRHGHASLANGIEQHGLRTLFYSQGVHGFTTERYPVRNITAPRNWLTNMRMLISLLREYQPRHVEVYLHYSGGIFSFKNLFSIGHVLIASAMGFPIVVFCTGGEILYWQQHNLLRRITVRLALARAKLIVVKELYMRHYMSKFRIGDVGKTVFLHNHITVQPDYHIERDGRRVLFLNSFKPWRRVDLVVNAAKQVLEDFPDAEFLVVGARSPSEAAPVERLVADLGLQDKVRVFPWVKDGTSWYESASVFVLPADIVFCNNSLLEAMERGTPPVVSDVPGAEKIVVNGESGLRVPQTSADLAKGIRMLLADEEFRCRLGEGARKKIIEDFSEDHRARVLLNAYRKRVWP